MMKSERLFKNWITTILGLAFLAGAGYVALVQKDIERATFLSGFGVMFLRTKDSLIGISAK